MKFETRAIHAGQEPEPRTGAISTPIFQTSTYVQDAPGEHKGYEYTRTHNPTRDALEASLAALEGGRHAMVYASGMATVSTIMTLLKQGDHVISSDDVYGGTYRVFENVFRDWGMEFSYVNTSSLDEITAAARPNTKMLWIETPTNPLLKITELKAAAAMARANGWTTVVDNTFASPYFQQPLAHGIDIVVHSMSKFIGGHADAIGGCAITSDEKLTERLRYSQNAVGACLPPFECWVFLRGIKTLAVRMRQHDANAGAIAPFLDEHPKVAKVLFPGLPSHPGHDLAGRQMTGYGGLISFYLKGTMEDARRVCAGTKLFKCAESLGGVESLIEHPGIMTHASIPEDIRREKGLGDDLIRLSVGIEHVDDLIADLEGALGAV